MTRAEVSEQFDLGEKLKSANSKNARKYTKLDNNQLVVAVDGKSSSSHLQKLLVLFPNQGGNQQTKPGSGSEDETHTSVNGNLEVAKAFSGYVKVCQLPTG